MRADLEHCKRGCRPYIGVHIGIYIGIYIGAYIGPMRVWWSRVPVECVYIGIYIGIYIGVYNGQMRDRSRVPVECVDQAAGQVGIVVCGHGGTVQGRQKRRPDAVEAATVRLPRGVGVSAETETSPLLYASLSHPRPGIAFTSRCHMSHPSLIVKPFLALSSHRCLILARTWYSWSVLSSSTSYSDRPV